MANKKLNKQLAFDQYKEKWGFKDCIFRTYNGVGTIYVDMIKDEQVDKTLFHEVRSLHTLIKRSSDSIKFREYNHTIRFNNLKEFQEYMLIRKLSGL